MAKQVKWESILDKLAKEIGEAPTHAKFNNDTVSFFNPSYQGPVQFQTFGNISPAAYDNENTVVIQNKERPNKKQFEDTNKQLQLPSSSTIQAAAYWQGKEYLVVSFKSGATYDYTGVPLKIIQTWEGAASAGSYFYYNIRMSYPYKKVG